MINGLSDDLHPCQLLADMQTFHEHRGSHPGQDRGLDRRWQQHVQHLHRGRRAVRLPAAIACPEGYEPKREFIEQAEGRVTLVRDPHEAVAGAHLVSTDVWASMGQEEELAARMQLFAPYQVSRKLLDQAASDVLFMHCLPAHRGEEISLDLLDDPRSVAWDQAENRLHAQKALLEFLVEHAGNV